MPRTCQHTPSLPVSQCFCLFLHMSSLLQPPGLCLSCSLCRGCPFSNLRMVAACLSGLNRNVTLSASPSLSTLSHPPVLILHLASNRHLLFLQSPACLLHTSPARVDSGCLVLLPYLLHLERSRAHSRHSIKTYECRSCCLCHTLRGVQKTVWAEVQRARF